MRRAIQKLLIAAVGLATVVLYNASDFVKTKSSTNSTPQSTEEAATVTTTTPGYYRVMRVVDGDTIELATGEKVRYIGVNTPETVDPRKGVQCFGHEASDYNKKLVEGKSVRLEKDVGDTDAYGRLLRYVYLEDGTFVNAALVSNGYAEVMTISPNVRYAKDFRALQLAARNAKKGLWNICK